MRLCIHTLFLIEIEEEAVDLSNAGAAVKKQWAADPHDLLSEKVIDNLAARCLQTIVWHECVRIHCRPCTSLKRKYKLVMTSRTQNLLSLVRLEIVAELFL